MNSPEDNEFNTEESVTDDNTQDIESAVSKTNAKKEIFSWIRLIVIVFVVVLVVKNFIIVNAIVPTSSMENTIMPDDRLIGFRLAYTSSDPKRFDIVIFKYPVDETQIYIKRVIGLPGETVEISEGKIYIDGSDEPLDEPYLKEEWTVENNGYVFEVPDDCYLVLGDNRNRSADSRYWADYALMDEVAQTEEEAISYQYVSEDKILGKAIFRYWPSIGSLTSVE